jgi:hypothetical protein
MTAITWRLAASLCSSTDPGSKDAGRGRVFNHDLPVLSQVQGDLQRALADTVLYSSCLVASSFGLENWGIWAAGGWSMTP